MVKLNKNRIRRWNGSSSSTADNNNRTKISSLLLVFVPMVLFVFVVFLWVGVGDRGAVLLESSSSSSSSSSIITTKTSSQQQHHHQQLYQNLPTMDAIHLLRQSLPQSRYKIHRNLEGITSLTQSNTTIVTSHFVADLNPYTDTYYAWVSHFLTIQDNMILFTCSKMVNRMKLLRSLWPANTVIVEIFDMHDLPITKLRDDDNGLDSFWDKQLNMDPYKDEHLSYEFYWMWLSKSYFVNEAIKLNLFESQFFVYSDIDLYKTKKYLNKRVVQKPNVVPNHSLLWITSTVPDPPTNPISDYGNDGGGDNDNDSDHLYHVGSMGAGKIDAWEAFHLEFARTLDKFVQAKLFVGNDDRILQSTCQINPELCSYVLAKDVSDDDPAVRACLRTVLHKGITGSNNKGVGSIGIGKKNKKKNNNKKKYEFYRGKLGYKNAGQGGKKLPKKKITG